LPDVRNIPGAREGLFFLYIADFRQIPNARLADVLTEATDQKELSLATGEAN